MGLLKHVILPLFAMINLSLACLLLLVNGSIDGALEISQPFGRDTNPKSGGVPATALEMHFLHAIGGTYLCFGVNMIVAIFSKSSKYRAMAVLMEVLYAIVDAYSYWSLERQIPGILYFVIGVGGVGLAVHAMEPGIFAKAKKKEDTKQH